MPLFECHAHMVLTGGDWKAAMERHVFCVDEQAVRQTLEDYQQAGIRYVRDGGDKHGASLCAQHLAPEYGIEYVSPAWPLSLQGRYGSFIGKTYTDMDDACQRIDEAIACGARFIKLMVSGILDFNAYGVVTSEPLSLEQMKILVDYAHAQGKPVMAHVNGAQTITDAVKAGVDSVEHGYYADCATLELMAQSNVVWVPTFAPICNVAGTGRFDDEVLERIAQTQKENVALAAQMGVAIACGSDAGAACVQHVQGARDEYAYLEEALGENTKSVTERGNALIQQLFC